MSWAELWDIARWVLPLAAGGIGWVVRDRRKDKALADIAEATVPAEVKLKDIGADQAHLVYVTQAFEAERSGLRAAITDRDAEIARQRAELQHRDQLIAHRDQIIAELRREIDDLQARLTAVRERLSELTDSEETS